MKPDNSDDTTHFGFQKVNVKEKADKVASVFRSVASKYDLMNDLMSLGVHRFWKRYAIGLCHLRPGQCVLDLAGGTGDLTRLIVRKVGQTGHVVLADINESMLEQGYFRLIDEGVVGNVSFTQLNAENLPFPDESFDCVTIGFGLRNVTDKDRALKSIFRVLKPGGQLMVLEFSKLTLPLLQSIYDTYSFSILPMLGRWVAGDEASYRYLAESIRMHPDQETLKNMMATVGFEKCDYHNLTGGIVAVHRGYKF